MPSNPKKSVSQIGLKDGYDKSQWGNYKSHSFLLSEAVKQLGWSAKIEALRQTFRKKQDKDRKLSIEGFLEILEKYDITDNYTQFYNLFDRKLQNRVTEADFLAGVLAVSPDTPHDFSSPASQLRLQHIFMYFDSDKTGKLTASDLQRMFDHIKCVKMHLAASSPTVDGSGEDNPDTANASPDPMEIYDRYTSPEGFDGMNFGGVFGYGAFMHLCEARIVTGTSQLLRMKRCLATLCLDTQKENQPSNETKRSSLNDVEINVAQKVKQINQSSENQLPVQPKNDPSAGSLNRGENRSSNGNVRNRMGNPSNRVNDLNCRDLNTSNRLEKTDEITDKTTESIDISGKTPNERAYSVYSNLNASVNQSVNQSGNQSVNQSLYYNVPLGDSRFNSGDRTGSAMASGPGSVSRQVKMPGLSGISTPMLQGVTLGGQARVSGPQLCNLQKPSMQNNNQQSNLQHPIVQQPNANGSAVSQSQQRITLGMDSLGNDSQPSNPQNQQQHFGMGSLADANRSSSGSQQPGNSHQFGNNPSLQLGSSQQLGGLSDKNPRFSMGQFGSRLSEQFHQRRSTLGNPKPLLGNAVLGQSNGLDQQQPIYMHQEQPTFPSQPFTYTPQQPAYTPQQRPPPFDMGGMDASRDSIQGSMQTDQGLQGGRGSEYGPLYTRNQASQSQSQENGSRQFKYLKSMGSAGGGAGGAGNALKLKNTRSLNPPTPLINFRLGASQDVSSTLVFGNQKLNNYQNQMQNVQKPVLDQNQQMQNQQAQGQQMQNQQQLQQRGLLNFKSVGSRRGSMDSDGGYWNPREAENRPRNEQPVDLGSNQNQHMYQNIPDLSSRDSQQSQDPDCQNQGFQHGTPQERDEYLQNLALRVVRQIMQLSNEPDFVEKYSAATVQLVSSEEMTHLCDAVFEKLILEDSLVNVMLPCRVYGDIHGQLPDLLQFFNAFSWPDKRRGDIYGMNYIFLGDFVDRGSFSSDTVTLLFSLKVLYPTKIFLIRGNHEDRIMNQNYGFLADCNLRWPEIDPSHADQHALGENGNVQCLNGNGSCDPNVQGGYQCGHGREGSSSHDRNGFSSQAARGGAYYCPESGCYRKEDEECFIDEPSRITVGFQIWERVNDVFEFLPIAALVEDTILCIHGGIGDSIHTLDDLRGIPKPIKVCPEITSETTIQDKIVLDALWSDPTDNDSVLGVHLSPRGQNTCRFGPDRVQEFNRKNGLKMIIRAHECVVHGYEYFANGSLLTVFSATNYCNQYNNDGGMVVLVRNPNGTISEHAQVIRSSDTKWNSAQFREPSPMRGTGCQG